jgi:hypothetical protein
MFQTTLPLHIRGAAFTMYYTTIPLHTRGAAVTIYHATLPLHTRGVAFTIYHTTLSPSYPWSNLYNVPHNLSPFIPMVQPLQCTTQP